MAKKASIRSRKHAPSALLGSSLFALGAMTVPLGAMAAEEAVKTESLPEVKVKATRDVPYKATQSASNKITQPLVDTPKTIQVVKKEMLREQGAVSLMDALRNTPGITMQLGENGNTSAGDAFQMRGFSTQNSIFVDGIRDTGAVTRDVFNIEQVEIVKGPAGSDVGRGSASGYINLISKLPFADTLSEMQVTIGSGDRKRVTTDLNRQISDSTAFRLNLMAQDSGVDGASDLIKARGYALAPSIAFGLGTPQRLYLYSQHVKQDNVPSGALPSIGLKGYFRGQTLTGDSITSADQASAITNGAKVDRDNFYGSKHDYEKVYADMYTIKSEFDLSSATTVRNITRYSRTYMDRVLTGVSAINGVNVGPTSGVGAGTVRDPSLWTVNRSRQRTDQLNEAVINQTSINTSLTQGGIKHDLVGGIEVMAERQLTLGTGTTAQTINGKTYAAIVNTAANLYNPNPNDVLGVPYLTGANNDGRTVTAAIYALDTLTLSEALKLNAGLRFEHYKISTNIGTIASSRLTETRVKAAENLASWNLGAVYKPAPNGSIYAGVANSLTPPGGANFVLSTSSTNQSNPGMDPQQSRTVELGTKWNLLDEKLSVAASVYNTENDKQISTDSLGVVTQTGKTRVRGIELDAVGQLTNFWQIKAGVAYMKSEQLGVSSIATTVTAADGTTTSNVFQTTDGVRWSPEWSGNLWTSYVWGDFTLGGGVTYIGEQKRLVTKGANLSQVPLPTVDGYEVFNLMAAYKVSKTVNLQLNVYNVFDKEYITVNNSGARLSYGVPQSFALTASLKF